MEWHEAITLLKPYVLRLSTPNGAGTGWLVSLSESTPLCAVATAAHVVEREHNWELPIRIFHPESGKSILLRAQDRAIHLIKRLDIAAIVFNKDDLPLPSKTFPLVDPGFYLKPGVEIGWLGFPGRNKEDLCFFSGRISFYEENNKRYLVDGVGMNGASGGPAFRCIKDAPEIIGVLSATLVEETGKIIHGLVVIQDVNQFHDIAQRFKSLDEAKSTESPQGERPLAMEAPKPIPPETKT